MNKKISYGCLVFCMALYSIDGFAARRNTSRNAGTTASNSRVRSASLVSGYSDKYFKSPSVTLVEKRSVELEPLMFTNNMANIKKSLSSNGTVVDAKYRLCVPCENIYLTYNDGTVNTTLQGDSQGEGNCYSLDANTEEKYYKLAVKSGAIEACGEKLRMTILDVRNKDVHTEVDSVVLNIKPNSSLYDYSNIKLDQDTEIYDLINNYTKVKEETKTACNGDILNKLKTLRNLLIGSTTTSAVSTITGGVDTALQTKNTIDMSKGENSLGKLKDSYDKCKQACTEDNPDQAINRVKCLENCENKYKNYVKEQEKYDSCCANVYDENGNLTSSNCQVADSDKNDTDKVKEAYKKQQECLKKANTLTGSEKASIALSAVSAAGNLTTMGLSIGVGSQINGLIDDLKACKTAAEKMHTAGMALEAGLEEIMSADE